LALEKFNYALKTWLQIFRRFQKNLLVEKIIFYEHPEILNTEIIKLQKFVVIFINFVRVRR